MVCCAAAAKHGCSSCRSSLLSWPYFLLLGVLLLLVNSVCGVPTQTAPEDRSPVENALFGARQHLLSHQQQPGQQEEQPNHYQEWKEDHHQQERDSAVTTLKLFGPEGVSAGVPGAGESQLALHEATAAWGAASAFQEVSSSAGRRPRAAVPPAASSSSEDRKPQLPQESATQAAKGEAFATADLIAGGSVSQDSYQHHLQQQKGRQQHQRPSLSRKTSGVFIAFKQLAAAAAAGAAAATRKRSAGVFGSGLQLPVQRQLRERQQRESLPHHQWINPLSRNPPRLNASERLRATHAAADVGPILAAAAAAADAPSTLFEVASGPTRAAYPSDRQVTVGLRRSLKAELWHHHEEVVPTAACSWGLSAVWLMQVCYSLDTCIAAEPHGSQRGAAAQRVELTSNAPAEVVCHCVVSGMPVLLHEEPLQQRISEQYKHQGAGRIIPVLHQQQQLLCCSDASYPPHIGGALQPQFQYHLFRAAAAKTYQVLAQEPAAALGKGYSPDEEQDEQNLHPPRYETTSPAANDDAGEATPLQFTVAESAATNTHSLSPDPIAIYGTQRKQHDRQVLHEEALQYSWPRLQTEGEPVRQQKPGEKSEGEQHEPVEGRQQKQQQQPISRQVESQHHELVSIWGRQLVSWTWRRACMRQPQLSNTEAAAAAKATAVAAAALCYRPPASTALAPQLLLLLLPHDLAVRLLAKTSTAQCQQLQQQQQQQQPQQPQQASWQVDMQHGERFLGRGGLRNHSGHHEAPQGSCAAPVERLNSGNICELPFENPDLLPFEFAEVGTEPEQQQTAVDGQDTQEGMKFKIQQEEQQQHEQPSWQHAKGQATQQQQTTEESSTDGQEVRDDSGSDSLQSQQVAKPVLDPQRQGNLEGDQQQPGGVMGQQSQQHADSSIAVPAAPGSASSGKLHAVSQGSPAKSAVGGVPGAPQLYGRGFVHGEQLPASFLRLHFNFASIDAGARVIASSPGMQHIKAVQRPDADTYMLVPCYVPSKYFVLSFSETLKIDFVVIQSFEIYANAFWHIQLLGADTYPTRQWRLIANLQTAADVSSELFDLKSECAALSSCWAKFLKVRLLTHHDEGPHYYCSLTSFQVFGATGVQFLETQIHDEFGEATRGTEGEAPEGIPSSTSPVAVSPSAVNAAALGKNDSRATRVEASLRTVSPSQPGAVEGISQQLETVHSTSFASNGPQDVQHLAGESRAVADMPEQLDEVQGSHSSAASLERLDDRNPASTDATAFSNAEGLHSRNENTGADDAHGEATLSHRERQRRGMSPGKNGSPPLDASTEAAARSAISADSEVERSGDKVPQPQQQRHSLLRVEEGEKQSAAALHALSGALEKALQQQQHLLKQKRQRHQQQAFDIQHDVLLDDPMWADVGYPSVSIPGLKEALSFRSSFIDSAVCTASSSNNARSVWQGYNPFIGPTTGRYICISLVEGTSATGAAAATGNKPIAAHQVHLVAAGANPSKTSKQLQVADAATEALRQAAAYARTFLLEALQHQQPQLQQSPIGAAFVRFLMTTAPGEQDQQAETLRVLSLLLQPPAVDVSLNGGGTSGDATKGGMAAAPSLGARDTKGEHVLVMLLERMKSLEGETAAFKAAAAERQQQLQIQQQHLLHLALLVQLQQQLGSFLFERLAAFDGLIPHLNPLVQLLDESEAAATLAAAAAQEEVLHGTVPAAAKPHRDPHCIMIDANDSGRNSSGQQKEQQRQQQPCRHAAKQHSWGWPWDIVKLQVVKSLEWIWRVLALPLVHWLGGIVLGARVSAGMLQQLFCSDAESAVVQQSCAAAYGLYIWVTSAAGIVANGAAMGANITSRGISIVAAFVSTAWMRLFAAVNQAPPPLSHDWSTGSSGSGHWTERFLMLQERGMPQSVDSSASTLLLLLLASFLAVSAALFWRLRRGQRVAAAAAGECALLRRSFELLQQQHQSLLHQLQQYKREQQLLLLLTASHHSNNASRGPLHQTKYETYETDIQQRQREVRLGNAVQAELSAGIVRTAPTHENAPSTGTAEPFVSLLGSEAQREAAVESVTAPSLLRRLSTSLAPRVFLGLTRNAGERSCMVTADYGGSNINRSNPSTGNTSAVHSSARNSDAMLLQRPEIMLQQPDCSCGPHEQQTQQEQPVQCAAAALLPALDTKAIRSLKLQRHTLRQRRQGAATTPMASPATAAVADGDSLLLSPAAVGSVVGPNPNTYISSGAEAAAVTTSSAAPSRCSSSRSSSVCSTSRNLHGVANSYLKSLCASHLQRSGTVAHISASLQPRKRPTDSQRAGKPRDSPDPGVSPPSNPSSSSSAYGDTYSGGTATAASQGHNRSCNVALTIPFAGRKLTVGDLAGQFGTGAEGAVEQSAAFSWGDGDSRFVRDRRKSSTGGVFAHMLSASNPTHETEPTQQKGAPRSVRGQGIDRITTEASLQRIPGTVAVVSANVSAAHSAPFAPDVARCNELMGGVVSNEANENIVVPPSFVLGHSGKLQQAHHQQHMQSALAPGGGRDGRRRRKKRGAS